MCIQQNDFTEELQRPKTSLTINRARSVSLNLPPTPLPPPPKKKEKNNIKYHG